MAAPINVNALTNELRAAWCWGLRLDDQLISPLRPLAQTMLAHETAPAGAEIVFVPLPGVRFDWDRLTAAGAEVWSPPVPAGGVENPPRVGNGAAEDDGDDDDDPPNPLPDRPQMRGPERAEQLWEDDDSGAAPPDRSRPPVRCDPAGVPAFLRSLPRWFGWRGKAKVDRESGEIIGLDKIPVSFHNPAACNAQDAGEWSAFERCAAVVARNDGLWDGLGITLGPLAGRDEILAGFDLDGCRDPATGELESWATDFLAAIQSYAEVSPSGTGVKVPVRIRLADLPRVRQLLGLAEHENVRRRFFGDKAKGQPHAPHVEMWLAAKYFTVTGARWGAGPDDVTALSIRQAELLAALFGPKPPAANITTQQGNGSPPAAIADMVAAMHLIPASCDYAVWVAIGMALYHETNGNPDALAAWVDWSETCPEKFDGAKLLARKWASFERRRETATCGAGTIFHYAKPYGWIKGDPRDTDANYFAALEADADAMACRTDPRPQIQITPASFVANAEQGERALLSAGAAVYRRLNKLVRPIDMELDAAPEMIAGVQVGRKTHAPGLIAITLPILRQMLHQAAIWMKYDGRRKKLVPAAPSNDAAELILHRVGFWPFPDVTGIIGTPVMRNDGSILSAPGYDPATGLILHNPPAMPDFNHAPSREDAEWACLRLKNDLLGGFPFVDDASRSVALSGLLTPIVRAAIKQAPMHGASAPLPGTGKSYLWDLASYIANGAAMPVMAAGRDEAETEKRIVMLLLKALSMWSIDNVNGALEGDFLCQVITQPRIMPRKLGVSDGPDPDILNTLTTYATGNNIRFLGDMPRRVAVAHMDANMERPELRTFATQPHKLILANRGRYIADCLTIPLGYRHAGSPNKLPQLAGFEEWSDVVRSALVWLGCADPINTFATTDNPVQEQIAALFQAWPQGQTTYSTAELLEVAQQRHPQTSDPLHPELLAALQPIAKDRRGSLDPTALGCWLRDHKDTVIGSLKLTRHGSRTRPLWGVAQV
jgi:putative DNA primase/helicase